MMPTRYIRRHLKPSTARWIVGLGIGTVAALCLALGLAYTALLPPDGALPGALQTLLELDALKRLGELGRRIPGGLWLIAAALGAFAIRWRRMERAWWFSALTVFGFWGGMHIGGVFTGTPRGWIAGLLFLLVGILVAIVWWAVDVIRLQAAKLMEHPTWS